MKILKSLTYWVWIFNSNTHVTWRALDLNELGGVTCAIPIEKALGESRQSSQTASWGKSLISTVKRDREPNTRVSMEPTVLANLGFLNNGVSMKEKKIWGERDQSLCNLYYQKLANNKNDYIAFTMKGYLGNLINSFWVWNYVPECSPMVSWLACSCQNRNILGSKPAGSSLWIKYCIKRRWNTTSRNYESKQV